MIGGYDVCTCDEMRHSIVFVRLVAAAEEIQFIDRAIIIGMVYR